MVHRNRSSNISLCRESAGQVGNAVLRFALVRRPRRYAKWYYNSEWKQIMAEAFVEIRRSELREDQALRQRAWQPVLEELRTLNQRLERLAELAGEIAEAVTRLVQCAESMRRQLLRSATRRGNSSDESQGWSDRSASGAAQAGPQHSSSRSQSCASGCENSGSKPCD